LCSYSYTVQPHWLQTCVLFTSLTVIGITRLTATPSTCRAPWPTIPARTQRVQSNASQPHEERTDDGDATPHYEVQNRRCSHALPRARAQGRSQCNSKSTCSHTLLPPAVRALPRKRRPHPARWPPSGKRRSALFTLALASPARMVHAYASWPTPVVTVS